MKLVLSTYGVTDLIRKLRFLESDIEDASLSIVNKLVDKGTAEAIRLNALAPKSGEQDNVIIPVHSTVTKDSKATGSITMQGPNAVYDEFGTGEYGASNPHPLKNNFGLNPYNSGPYVSTHISKSGKHYWFYRPMAGKDPHYRASGYTEGIPSGKQMYNTAQLLKKEKNSISTKILSEYLRKYNSKR